MSSVVKALAGAREAERRLEREYEPLKAETLRSLSAKLRGRGVRLPDEDLEEYYNQAWHALYAQAASGTEIANTGGFLVQVAFRRAIDDVRRQRLDERADLPLEDVAPVEHDVVQRLDDQRRLREFTEALREELDERERVAASLCYVHGYTRPEAAELMGMSERRMQKVMDAVSKAVGRITEQIQTGQRCQSRTSVNKAYALGLLDSAGERYAAARAHLDECARCRADVLGLRGLASIAPPSLLPWAALRAAGGGASTKSRRRPRRPNPTAAAAAAAAAALVTAGAAFGITRGSSDPDGPLATTRPASGQAATASQSPADSTAVPAASSTKPARNSSAARRARSSDPARDSSAARETRSSEQTQPDSSPPPATTWSEPPPPTPSAAPPPTAPTREDNGSSNGKDPNASKRKESSKRDKSPKRGRRRPDRQPAPAPTPTPAPPPTPPPTPTPTPPPVPPVVTPTPPPVIPPDLPPPIGEIPDRWRPWAPESIAEYEARTPRS